MFVSRWIVKLLLSAFCLTSVVLGTGHAQDLRIARTVGPYAHGVAVENLEMVEPGSLALSLAINQGAGVLDAIDPPSGRRVSVIDTHLHVDLSLAWQYNDEARFHVAAAASHASGQAFGSFDGGGYEFGDVDFGVRWRLLNQKDLGLELGLYSDLVFPTGDSTQLAGGGSTNLHVGTLLSQRFDDLTFLGMLGYRHRFNPAKFADAAFRNVVDYRAGLYVPLDWPNWIIFTEIAGLLNATSSNTDGTEPAEVFGGVTFGEFTNVSIAYSTGLNDQGGASARRLSLRIAHHFDAQDRATVATIQPASMGIAHFDTQRGRALKAPVDLKNESALQRGRTDEITPRSNAFASVDETANKLEQPMAAPKVRKESAKATDSPASRSPQLIPHAKLIKPAQGLTTLIPPKSKLNTVKKPPSKQPSTVTQGLLPTPPKGASPSATKKKVGKTTKVAVPTQRTGNKNTESIVKMKTPTPTRTAVKAPATKTLNKAAQGAGLPPVLQNDSKHAPSKAKHTKLATQAAQSTSSAVQYPLRRPGPKVKPMVSERAPMTLVYTAGQTVSSPEAFKRLVNELKVHVKTAPATNQILIEAYAGPGERAYTPHTHTAQRDAYLLANTRSKDVLTKLKRFFPKLNFKQAPRIWPSHIVVGNDFWSGVVLTPLKGSAVAENSIQKITADSGAQLTLNLTLQRPVAGDAVDVLTDGLDVVIIRIKSINEVRKWMRLKHPAIKRALIHPSYETSNAGILRVRLNGTLPTNYRDALKVSVQGKRVQVQLPTLAP
jgi:hypothetical protein